ncbi:proton-conducting transporter membrane subunit [Lacipirellula parvula]|uniref:NADH-ubiquinone oxidoreductase chain M n=1 Tax=Lacipirellula parvula TaxID=2650471 RepID=A0A5K7XIJ0_9BACT|nr:proton-conducting transporter membrane subunit [Lacipirellula parvula]BBO35817.1 NADH-ubiquinone oxidoreductase chain M [Lacipirellula parvula]
MTELHLPWLQLAIALPALGALSLIGLRNHAATQRRTLLCSGLSLACAAGAWLDFGSLHAIAAHDRWSIASRLFGVEFFVIDELNAPLLPMAALISFVTALATLRTKFRHYPFTISLLSETILLATLSCRHSWGIVALLAISVLPPLWELHSRGKPMRVFAIHISFFVTLLVAGWWLVERTTPGTASSSLAFGLLTAAVLLRCGAVPFHCWITDLFEHAAFGTSLLFVTPMVGVYAAVRLLLPTAPDWALQSLALVSIVTAVYAAGMALVQRDGRRFFCYLFLSHSSLVLVGLESATPIGLTGALCLWISVGLALTGFGLTLRAIESRTGRLSLSEFHGLYEHTPTLAAFFLITGLASIGFPGTIGFVGAELLLEGAIGVHPWICLLAVLTAALNGIAVLQAYFRIFTGKRYFPTISLRSRLPERIAVLALAALLLGGGLFPQPGLTSRYRAASELIAARLERLGQRSAMRAASD